MSPESQDTATPTQTVESEKHQPLARYLFLYFNDQTLRTNKSIRQFVSHDLRNISALVNSSNYIPQLNSTYRLVDAKLYRHILCTSYGGVCLSG